jgi:hypothetical protein
MSTRSIIVVTGKTSYNQDSTVRIYRHQDGYPTENLALIGSALKIALEQCSEYNSKFNQASDPRQPIVDQVVGLLLGASTWVYGMAARIDDDDGEKAVYSASLKPEYFGNQGDLEWVYVVDLNEKTVNVYGGDYSDPQDHLSRGVVDPTSYAKQLREEFQEREASEINAAMKSVTELSFTINGGSNDPNPKRKLKAHSGLKDLSTDTASKHKALVKIVRDAAKGQLRAQCEGKWVRFPKHLRIEGSVYEVQTLKAGKGGSWIACGQIKKRA